MEITVAKANPNKRHCTKIPAEHTQACCENNRCDSHDLDDRRKQFKHRTDKEEQSSRSCRRRPKEHVAFVHSDVQQNNPFASAPAAFKRFQVGGTSVQHMGSGTKRIS